MKGQLNRGRVGAVLLLALALFSLAEALPSNQLLAPSADRPALFTIRPSPSNRPAPEPPSASASAGIALAQPGRVIPAGRPSIHVPILMYHYIRENPESRDRLGFNLSVTPADFSSQMAFLAAHGFHPIDMRDLRDYLLGRHTLPARPVIITLDDGYRDLYSAAYPVLKQHHFKAVAYIISGFVGGPETVTREQVLEMEANRIEIASHTVSHPDLTKLSAEELHRQLQDSKLAIEALLGHPVLDFCYPAGQVNPTVLQAVQAAGYETATTTSAGTQHSASDRYLWARVRVGGGESLGQFAASLGPEEPSEPGSATGEPRPQEAAGPSAQANSPNLTLSPQAPVQAGSSGAPSP
jgi:peptidoglycan/xylan/chitin deacetylase (PgdA/CDA1 family)